MNRIIPKIKYLIFLCFLLSLIAACKDPIEGCRDIDAVNYDVTADKPCPDDCCTYPQIILEISHQYDTLNFSLDSTYMIAGKPVRFDQIIFYWSDFKIISANDTLEVSETIDLDIIGGGTETVKDDFTLISRSIASFKYNVGEFQGTGDFTSLSFTAGLKGNVAFANANSLIENHPLAINVDTLWTFGEGYVFNRIIVTPDTLNPELRQLDIRGTSNLVEISLDFEQSVNQGFNVTIPIVIDYKKWFEDIDFEQDENIIIGQIVDKTANAISILE